MRNWREEADRLQQEAQQRIAGRQAEASRNIPDPSEIAARNAQREQLLREIARDAELSSFLSEVRRSPGWGGEGEVSVGAEGTNGRLIKTLSSRRQVGTGRFEKYKNPRGGNTPNSAEWTRTWDWAEREIMRTEDYNYQVGLEISLSAESVKIFDTTGFFFRLYVPKFPSNMRSDAVRRGHTTLAGGIPGVSGLVRVRGGGKSDVSIEYAKAKIADPYHNPHFSGLGLFTSDEVVELLARRVLAPYFREK